ncbi:MAG: hypothetical protein V2A53_06340, partial [bacterium]
MPIRKIVRIQESEYRSQELEYRSQNSGVRIFVTLYSPEVKLAFGEIKYNHETPKERKHEKLKDKSFSNSISIFSFGL